ncbi:MAG TPA: hypothetical protein VLE72_02345 [Candidatus Saccharimonadales bacterium]|nr:hypothetical protein [Candidatus Saccharimonadales bacterium]
MRGKLVMSVAALAAVMTVGLVLGPIIDFFDNDQPRFPRLLHK